MDKKQLLAVIAVAAFAPAMSAEGGRIIDSRSLEPGVEVPAEFIVAAVGSMTNIRS